jgi:3-deoxy-D-arabino-heptulosonate 7-phosphate (DAHP) synthase class II
MANEALERLQDKLASSAPVVETDELTELRRKLAKSEGKSGYAARCEALKARIAELEAPNG